MVRKRTAERPSAGFNLVAVKGNEGICLHYDGTLRPVTFGPGRHVITNNHDLNDPSMPEKKAFDALPDEPTVDQLKAFLRHHEGERPVCKHGEKYGTVSSTIYAAGQLHFANGMPCETEYKRLTPE